MSDHVRVATLFFHPARYFMPAHASYFGRTSFNSRNKVVEVSLETRDPRAIVQVAEILTRPTTVSLLRAKGVVGLAGLTKNDAIVRLWEKMGGTATLHLSRNLIDYTEKLFQTRLQQGKRPAKYKDAPTRLLLMRFPPSTGQ